MGLVYSGILLGVISLTISRIEGLFSDSVRLQVLQGFFLADSEYIFDVELEDHFV